MQFISIDKSINRFRLASREIFNNFFLEDFLKNEDWDFYEQFTCIEEELFYALVASRAGINANTYGLPQTEILARPSFDYTCGIPILLDKDIDSGCWDCPTKTAPSNCVFTFISFFDWDQKSYKDNRYLRAIVKEWPEMPDLVGKHALIETIYLSYNTA